MDTTHGSYNPFGRPLKQKLEGYLRRSLTAFPSSEIRSNTVSDLLLTDTSLTRPVLQNLQLLEFHNLQR